MLAFQMEQLRAQDHNLDRVLRIYEEAKQVYEEARSAVGLALDYTEPLSASTAQIQFAVMNTVYSVSRVVF